MLSVYLRPWVLHRKHASPHVPHIADLDICVSDLLQAERVLRQRRMSMKTHVPGVGRNFATAWRQYRSAHVVSQHAARTIRNFLATQLAESAEADVEEDEDGKRAPWEPVDTSWVSSTEIKDIMDKNVALQFQTSSKDAKGKHAA